MYEFLFMRVESVLANLSKCVLILKYLFSLPLPFHHHTFVYIFSFICIELVISDFLS